MTEKTEMAIGWLQHLIDSAEKGTTTQLQEAVLTIAASIAAAVDTPHVRELYLPIAVRFVEDDREWVNRVLFADNSD